MREQSLRVLLAEGRAALREPLAESLRKNHSYFVDTAANAEELWEHVTQANKPYQVLLIPDAMSINPQGKTTPYDLDLISKVKSYCPSLEIVTFTPWQIEEVKDTVKAGGFRRLTAPFNNDDFYVQNPIFPDPASIVDIFASQAAAAIENAWLHAEMNKRMRVLSDILQLCVNINSSSDLTPALNKICKSIVDLFRVSHSCFILFPTNFEGGQMYAEYPNSGNLTQITSLHVVSAASIDSAEPIVVLDIENDPLPFDVRTILPDFDLRSVLIVPMMSNDRTLGILVLSMVGVAHVFTEEEINYCRGLATHLAVAIENTRLLDQPQNLVEALNEEKLDGLVDSYQKAIIAIDRHGKVIAFNEQAEKIMGFTAGEVMGISVAELYWDKKEPNNIGDLLTQKGGRLVKYDTFVKGKQKNRIPIRLSATWIYKDKEIIGSAGYFATQERERHIALLLQMSDVIAQAKDLTKGLESLAKMTLMNLSDLPHTFCRILIMDESEQQLLVEGAYVNPSSYENRNMELKPKQPLVLSDWRDLKELLESGSPKVLHLSDKRVRSNLERLSRSLKLDKDIQSLLAVPLKIEDRVIGLIEIGELEDEERRAFAQEEKKRASDIAAQTRIIIDRMRLQRIEVRRASQFGKVIEAVESFAQIIAKGNIEETLDSIVNSAKTVFGSTSVVLFRYDQQNERFDHPPKMIGVKYPKEARKSEETLRGSIVEKILHQDKEYIVEDITKDSWFKDKPFAQREKVKSCIAIPLKAADGKMGVMFVNYSSPHRFTKDEVKIILLLANQAAVAISYTQNSEQARKRAKVLESLYESGQAITSSLELEQTLNQIAQQALLIIGCTGKEGDCFSHVALLKDNILEFIAASSDEVSNDLKRERVDLNNPESRPLIVGRAAKNKRTENVGGVQQDPDYLEIRDYIRSQLSVPMKISGPSGEDNSERVIGVLSIEHHDLNAFSDDDVKNIESLSSQAAIAIDKAQRYEELQNFHQAAKAVAEESEPLQIIVDKAKEMLRADSAALWPYDDSRGEFFPEEMVSSGIPETELGLFRAADPNPGRIARSIMEEGVRAVPDIDLEPETIGDGTRDLLKRIGMKSFLGMCLKIAEEPIGILYTNYKQCRQFREDDRRQLKSFASYASLILGAKRSKKIMGAKLGAEIIAYLAANDEIDALVYFGALAVQVAANCDAITLYIYDTNKKVFYHPPTSVGLKDTERVSHKQSIRRESLVYKMFEKDSLYPVENISTDTIFRDSRFAQEEKIKSCVVVPLIAMRKVGVMFVNYRSPHKFTLGEIESIRVYANQVAAAISNAQALDESTQIFKSLYESGQAITGSLDLEQTLSKIAKQALQIMGTEGQEGAYFSHVAILENGSLNYIAASDKEIYDILLGEGRSKKDIYKQEGRLGIAGRAVVSGKTQNVGNVNDNLDYNIIREDIQSQLSVPLKVKNEIIGVLTIEHSKPNVFTDKDVKNIELLAAQAAVAVKNVQQFEELTKVLGLVRMGMPISTWQHDIKDRASIISKQIVFLRDEIDKVNEFSQSEQVSKILDMIERQAKLISRDPISHPPSADEGVSSILINDLITKYIRQLIEFTPALSGSLEMDLDDLDDAATTRASEVWLREAIDIVVGNAIDATADLPEREIIVRSKRADIRAEISIIDNGKGIPAEIMDDLFRKRITKNKGAKGWGVGLLIAQVIVRTYGGNIRCDSTGPTGTTMTFSLPLEAESSP